jgi:predicted transcriptional regulator
MRIIKEKSENPLVPITFRIPKEILDEVTKLAEKNDVSRQKLVIAILEQALNDNKFELKIKE